MADIELPNPEDIEAQKKDTFTKRVALTVAIYAVVLAVASLGGNNAAKDANMNQQYWANQYAHYQARVIREHLYRIGRMRLEVDLVAMTSEQRTKAEEALKKLAGEETRYQAEKKENDDKAKEFGEERDRALRQDPYFDYAEVLLQIAIVLASVSMLANSRPVFFSSLLLALVGGFLTFNGYTLAVKLPFLG